MKKKRFRGNGWKVCSIVLAHLAVAVSVLCVLGAAFLYSFGVPFYEKEAVDFVETEGFASNMQYAAMTIEQGVRAKAFLEEGKKENGLLDIREYRDGDTISWENTSGLAYRFEDLLAWSEEGVYREWSSEADRLELAENYPPDGAEDIEDAVSKSRNWALNQAKEDVYETLTDIGNLRAEQRWLEEYEPEVSNVRYIYADLESKEVYSNVPDVGFDNYEEVLETLKEEGVLIDQRTEETPADVWGWEEDPRSIYSTRTDIRDSDQRYVYAVWADTDFAADDNLARANRLYELISDRGMYLAAGAIGGVLVFLLCMLQLTAAAGRRPKDDRIHLNFFDRIYGEFLIAGTGLLALLGVFAAESILYYGQEKLVIPVIAVGSMLCVSGFLILYLSLVRRIKGGVLWKNTLLRAVCRFIGRIFAKCKNILCSVLERIHGRDPLLVGMKEIAEGNLQYKIPLEKLSGKRKLMGEYVNRIGDGLGAAVENSLKNERMKTELITNVSHDIKTPLTSIINYVDLLKRENIADEKIQGYIRILEEKAQRLKVLTEDVVEASKASTGNITLEMTDLDFRELFQQVLGEFGEKLEARGLTLMIHQPQEPVMIHADGQRLWRVLENIFGNVVKYAMEGTRVYAEISVVNRRMLFTLKNISAQPLNISADELTERFIRGDVSRNTEGSGLGLSIAKSLTELQGGEFKLYLDGDLFKVMIVFPNI